MRVWSSRNLTRLELVFAVLVILVLISVILNRALVYLAVAESSMVDRSVINMNTALQVEAALRRARGGDRALLELKNLNPAVLMGGPAPVFPNHDVDDPVPVEYRALVQAYAGRTIPNYIGEFGSLDEAGISGGQWYYDTSDRMLVYRVNNSELFRSSLDGPARIRFQIMLKYDDVNNSGRFDPGIDRYRGIALVPVDNYRWLF